MQPPAIRPASPADAEAIAAIYAHHVRTGTASFDVDPPPAEFWKEKIGAIASRGWPFLVAAAEDTVVGYAYVSQFRDRPAYARTCEDSIYVDGGWTGKGVGSALMSALVDAARDYGFEQIIAVIGGAEPASVALHAKAGFVEAGRMRKVGRKFGRVLDTLYMQRDLTAD
ncbi:GNAT family N-acetyltransferase [Tsuneonella sp. YG55]|uniref:GNAT family N-acetyltransferase n=1 Tax=Tsuneonella litorea TaxID=2976475 RepID=A0A9X2W2I2_9SPHN|nr:GNAT family N-acetyltransferase [Tsuneonella litorea]MCT2558775.1 GNAT family N-acetyltransferase [Tsuneonella litorea]